MGPSETALCKGADGRGQRPQIRQHSAQRNHVLARPQEPNTHRGAGPNLCMRSRIVPMVEPAAGLSDLFLVENREMCVYSYQREMFGIECLELKKESEEHGSFRTFMRHDCSTEIPLSSVYPIPGRVAVPVRDPNLY